MSTDEKSKKYYKENAQKYTNHVRNPKDSVYHSYYEKPAMYSMLPDLKNKTVLSMGCGSGEDSTYLKGKGAERSVGIDITEELINIAKNSYKDCEFYVMDMEALDFQDESFDFVYSSLAIHYVENWENVFRNVYRVLKKDSNFLFSCNHPVRFAMDSFVENNTWVSRLEIAKDIDSKELSFVGNYLEKRKLHDILGKDTANGWSIPIGDITKMITEAGFVIEAIVEPRPLEGLKDIDLNTYLKLSRIPEFIIFKLLKR